MSVDSATLRPRQGRCFELAGKFILADESKTSVLVHGTVDAGRSKMPIEHAWIVLEDGRIYEPVEDTFFSAEQFTSTRRPNDETRFSYAEALIGLATVKNWGPWNDAEQDAIRKAARTLEPERHR